MVRRCLRTVTKLGLNLGVATGIGFVIYRLIESRRNQSRSDSVMGDASSPVRPEPMASSTDPTAPDRTASPVSAALGPVSAEPTTPDPPLVEPEMLTSVKGLRNREPIAGVGFGSGSEANGSSPAGSDTAGSQPSAPSAETPDLAEPPSSTLSDGAPATKRTPAKKQAGPAKQPSAATDKPSKPKRKPGDTGPMMPPPRKPRKSSE